MRPTQGTGHPFTPTDQQRAKVRTLVAAGFTRDAIAIVTNIPSSTLDDNFAFELKEGKTIVDAQILGGIVEQAIEGDKTMRIFYAKARAGWDRTPRDADGAQAIATFSIQIGSNLANAAPPGGNDSAAEISVSVIPNAPRTIDGALDYDGPIEEEP